MASIYARGKRLWFRLRDESGKWVSRPTPNDFDTCHEGAEAKECSMCKAQRAKAKRYARTAQEQTNKRAAGTVATPDTVRSYATKWKEERVKRGVGTAKVDLSRLEKYALPQLGSIRLAEVKPRDVRDVVRALRAANTRAPRTILHIKNSLHAMFESALVDELIATNPVMFKPGELPKKQDKDPTWRSQATYTVNEVERLISDARIPVERRVQYALKAIAGLRHGEMAALRWRYIDHDAAPLARINVMESYDSATQTVKGTKTGDTRAVPMHPTLAKILATWKLSHWERIYGRAPTADDFVVPARTLQPIHSSDANHAMKDDLDALELRRKAGKSRDRGGHDLRSWYKTRCIEDGADSLIIRRTTHAPPKDVDSGYERFSWGTICRELSKLKVEILDGEVLALATGCLATAIEAAILAADLDLALALVAQLRELAVTPSLRVA